MARHRAVRRARHGSSGLRRAGAVIPALVLLVSCGAGDTDATSTAAGGGPDTTPSTADPPAPTPSGPAPPAASTTIAATTTTPPAPTTAPTTGATAPTSAAPITTATTAADGPSTTTTTADGATGRLTVQSPMTIYGVGPVRYGMTVAEAEVATGMAMTVRPYPDPSIDCGAGRFDGGPPGLSFMVVGGEIRRADVVDPALGGGPDGEAMPGARTVETFSDVGIGSTLAEVHAAYPDRLESAPHPYGGPDAPSSQLTFVPDDASDAHRRLVLETSAEPGGPERVYAFRAGLLPEVALIEHCS